MKAFLDYMESRLKAKENNSLNLSMNDVHANGLFSLVIDGTEPGTLTRVFIATKELKPFNVQYHTHRYPITLTVLKGDITHHTARITKFKDLNTISISQFKYKSFLNGGDGLSYEKEVYIKCDDYKLPIGSEIELSVDDFHTMSCSKKSIWVVQEHGFKVDSSKVLGVPFVVDGLYNSPAMFQINDRAQQVLKEVRKMKEAYQVAL